MGKWAEVQCACPNRTPLPGSDFYFGQPHRQKKRLTRKQKEEVEEWERTTKNMFECGHRYGVVIELCPGQIINLGYLLTNIVHEGFDIFTRVGDWRCYEDELLLIQPDESEMWLMEVDEIRRALGGAGNLPRDQVQKLILEFLRMHVGLLNDLRRRLNEAAATMPFANVTPLMKNVEESAVHDVESIIEKIREALSDATLLCRASIETGNPIRLLW